MGNVICRHHEILYHFFYKQTKAFIKLQKSTKINYESIIKFYLLYVCLCTKLQKKTIIKKGTNHGFD